MADTYNPTLPAALAPVVVVYNRKMNEYIKENRLYWSKKLGLGGTASNIESTVAFIATWGGTGFKSGCIALAGKSVSILEAVKPEGWKVAEIRVGLGFEHHAAVMWEEAKGWRSGIVFDAWIHQKPALYSVGAWKHRFKELDAISPMRLEE